MRLLDVIRVTPPAGDVVTAAEYIDHARLNGLTVDRQPELIQRQIDAATARCERYLRRSLLPQTLRALFAPDGKNCACTLLLVLPRGPVTSVESITSLAADTPVDPSAYRVEWNTVILNGPIGGAAAVEYKSAGFGADAAAVPAPIREGILEYATTLYEDRRGVREAKYQATAGQTIPAGVVDLWRPYQIEVSG